MKRLVTTAVIVVLTLFFTNHGFGQTSEELKSLREDIKALKERQEAIQKDLQEIKTLLRTRQTQPPFRPPFRERAQLPVPFPFKEAVVSIDAGHVKGDKDAKLVMIDFSEYQ